MRKSFIYITVILLFIVHGKGWAQEGSSDYQYALIEAVKQKNLGNIPGAIELYKMVIEAKDSVAIAYYELGTLYMIANQPQLAEKNFRRAYQLDNSNEWYVNGYIDVLLMEEKFNEAEQLVEKTIITDDNEIEYSFKKANIYFLGGKSRKAIRSLNRLEKKYGVSDKVVLLKANIFESEEKFSAARKEIEKLIEFFPESLQFLVVAAELALKDKQNDLASKYYTKVLELDSTNIYALTNLTDYYRVKKEHNKSLYYLKKSFESDYIEFDRKMSILSYYLTDQYFLGNHSIQLNELIQTLIKKYPDEKDVKLYAVDFYIQQRKYPDAFALLRPLLTMNVKDYELWRQGILLANALSENEELLLLANEAYKIFPDSSEVVYFKGIAEYENKLFEEVIETFSNEVITKHSNRELVLQTQQIMAEVYHKLELYEESDKLFRILIEQEPDNSLVLNNFSYYLATRGESLDEARAMSYRTILENPENGTFLDTYAWVLFKVGEYKEAELYINKALQKGGLNDPDVNEHAAEIHMKLESYHIARSFYEKAIILGGDKEKLTKKLEKLGPGNEK